MFGKKEIETAHMETVIGAGSRFQGNIRSKGFVRIDGSGEGGVSAEGVTHGERSHTTGDIVAKSVFVAGRVTGNVTAANALELQPKGQITGDVRAAQLSIAEGALFEGNCVMSAEKIGAVEIQTALENTPA